MRTSEAHHIRQCRGLNTDSQHEPWRDWGLAVQQCPVPASFLQKFRIVFALLTEAPPEQVRFLVRLKDGIEHFVLSVSKGDVK